MIRPISGIMIKCKNNQNNQTYNQNQTSSDLLSLHHRMLNWDVMFPQRPNED